MWEATLANYKITSGLLALALLPTGSGARPLRLTNRNRADEIKNQGKQLRALHAS